jgi:hypothetical protein
VENWGGRGFVPLHTQRFQREIFNTPLLAAGILCFLLFIFFSSCVLTGKNNYTKSGVENARFLCEELEKISRGKYSMTLSYYVDRFYYSYRTSQEPTSYYVELPKIPGGFFLQYEKREGDRYNPFPALRYLGNGHTDYRNIFLKEAYIYENRIVIKPMKKDYFLEVLFVSPLKAEIIDLPDKDYKTKYIFSEFNTSDILTNSTWGVWALMIKKEKYYSISLCNGIIAAGLVCINSMPYFAGETIYGYFSFSLNSEELIFYKSSNEFNKFIEIANFSYKVSILPFGYYENLYQMIRGKERIICYTEISQD